MLHSIEQLYGDKLGASDGEIGHVKDFYFDDQSWAVRYVVADTGSCLPGRQVLIPPDAFGSLHQAGKVLRVNLTRKQIEDSPSIESHRPVTRQYEAEYDRYPASDRHPEPAEAHLRSAQAVNGYHVRTGAGTIGHICGFMMDAQSWAIGQLVIKTAHALSGEEVLIPTSKVNRISYEESTVFVNLASSRRAEVRTLSGSGRCGSLTPPDKTHP